MKSNVIISLLITAIMIHLQKAYRKNYDQIHCSEPNNMKWVTAVNYMGKTVDITSHSFKVIAIIHLSLKSN